MRFEDMVRVKADTKVWTPHPDSDVLSPRRKTFGSKLQVLSVVADEVEVEIFDTGGTDIVSKRCLEPWVEGEKWNGSAWVPGPAKPVTFTPEEVAAIRWMAEAYAGLLTNLTVFGLSEDRMEGMLVRSGASNYLPVDYSDPSVRGDAVTRLAKKLAIPVKKEPTDRKELAAFVDKVMKEEPCVQ